MLGQNTLAEICVNQLYYSRLINAFVATSGMGHVGIIAPNGEFMSFMGRAGWANDVHTRVTKAIQKAIPGPQVHVLAEQLTEAEAQTIQTLHRTAQLIL